MIHILLNTYQVSDYLIRHEFFHAFEMALNRIAGKAVFAVYAKTNGMEDRAVLAEIIGPKWASEVSFTSSHIQAKLRRISVELRRYFKSLENAGPLPWELPLR